MTRPSLADLAEAFWQATLAFDPLFATTIGEPGHDDRLPDRTRAAVAAERARLAELARRLEALDPVELPEPDDGVTRSALAEAVGGRLAELEADLWAWTVDPLEGPQVAALNLADVQPAGTPEERATLLARWRAIGPWLDAYGANLRRGLAEGLVAARTPVERVVGEIETILATPNGRLALLAPGRQRPADGADGEFDRFRTALVEIVETEIRPAFERLRRTLAEEILPRARPDDRAGLCHLPGGLETYRRLVRVHTSLDLEPETLHAAGRAEVERIDGELAELGRRVLGARDLAETIARLRGDPALHFSTGDEIRAVAERSLARARAALPDWFGRLPSAPCVVAAMGDHEAEHSTIAYYRPPAADGRRPGEYRINCSAPTTRPRYEAEALAFHEAIPGHHLQIALAQERAGLPAFRRHLGTTAFVEGWALYAERLAAEMGLYSGRIDRFGILSYDAWRACRLVVDTGLHALGWTRDEAIAYMTAHTALAPNNIANEVDRYIVWPGQALAYKTGQLEILRLRGAVEAALGSAFDLRRFHDVLLGEGAVPLPTLRSVVAGAFGLDGVLGDPAWGASRRGVPKSRGAAGPRV